MPIGPSLPPHLQQQRPSPSDADEPEAGPSLPQSARPVVATVATSGPTYPDSESDDENDFGPVLPPHLAALRKSKASSSSVRIPSASAGANTSARSSASTSGPQRPISGPARPDDPLILISAPSPQRVNTYGEDRDQDQDESDDEVGPKFVPGEQDVEKSAVEIFMEREARWAKEREEAAKPKEMKREEWMLVPPEAGDLAAATDPLRKRPTGFNRTSTPAITAKDQTLWTETPAEKLQRIQDEVAGKKRKPEVGVRVSVEEEEEARRKRKRDKEIKRSIEKHNDSHRAASLLEIHAKSKKDAKEAEKPPAIWDRDRDMGVTGRLLSDPERLQKIKDARGLNDRFGHGKAGAFSM